MLALKEKPNRVVSVLPVPKEPTRMKREMELVITALEAKQQPILELIMSMVAVS